MMDPKEYEVADYLTGEKFEAMCDVDAEKDPDWRNTATNCPKPVVTIFTQTHELQSRVPIISGIPGKKFVVVSHNSDGTFGREGPARHFDFKWFPVDNIIHWFCQNCEVTEPNVTPIPIALENTYIFPPKVKQHSMHHLTTSGTPKQEKAFLCFNMGTNPKERGNAWLHCSNTDWATCQEGFNNIDMVKPYMDQMAQHWFIVCPDGNGIDTIRMWEALYMGSIPIVTRHVFTEYYAQFLPIAIIDSWDMLSPQWMRDTLAQMRGRTYNWDVLKVDYWKKRIAEHAS